MKRMVPAATAAMILTAALPMITFNTFAADTAAQDASAPPDAETILLDWLPETEAAYQDFVIAYGHLSVHDFYIVYCDEVNYSTGDEVVVAQSGDGEVTKVKEYNISDALNPPGTPSKVVMVFAAIANGELQLTLSQGRAWEPDAELTEKAAGSYVVNEDYSITEKISSTDPVMGDLTADGTFDRSDIELLQKWLLTAPDTALSDPKAADFNADGQLNAADLSLMKRALAEQRASEAQTLLECEGSHIGISMEQGWYETKYSKDITDQQLQDHPDILRRLEAVNAKAEQLRSAQMTAWNFGVSDYGEDYLYLPYSDTDGNADRILLCKFGGECGWLEDADVQMLASLLIENGYFADADTFAFYIENR